MQYSQQIYGTTLQDTHHQDDLYSTQPAGETATNDRKGIHMVQVRGSGCFRSLPGPLQLCDG